MRHFGDDKNVVIGDVLAQCFGYGGREDIALPVQAEGTQGAVLGCPVSRLAAEDEVEEAGSFERGFQGGGEGSVCLVVVAGGAGTIVDAVHGGGFDGSPTCELPICGGDLVDEGGFDGGTRCELGDEAVEKHLEFWPVRGGGCALGAAAVAESVHGRDCLALGRYGAAGLGAVNAGLLGSG